MEAKEFLPVVRELARCYQAFECYSSRHVRSLGLTPSQFDIIATLGNTEGMTFKQLGEMTLITKGTLTGVVDRLVARQLVKRVASPMDGRSQIVQLTDDGVAMFERTFPAAINHLGKALDGMTSTELDKTHTVLRNLTRIFKRETKAG
ncbi:MAG: MarR family transcriptional regulator [Sideroxydans sp.]|nr:MarR family transcriptional regulator [Sideroxydans sp.]